MMTMHSIVLATALTKSIQKNLIPAPILSVQLHLGGQRHKQDKKTKKINTKDKKICLDVFVSWMEFDTDASISSTQQ